MSCGTSRHRVYREGRSDRRGSLAAASRRAWRRSTSSMPKISCSINTPGHGPWSIGPHDNYPAVVDYDLFCSDLHAGRLEQTAGLAGLWRIEADRVRVNLAYLAECNVKLCRVAPSQPLRHLPAEIIACASPPRQMGSPFVVGATPGH
jgi:hypothetical protein